ncbi:hypothetical protein [Methylobacterium sp. J-070]|uniref:hypothetical protein n=1 Tax=Methylobacterium sp. J-070 TaxID=2836650 RepID=UPI001FBA1D9B|nr:hypothetical protein [Methylobacterium sp. J-070]MCJ2054092.1 hypothetical protein [Methylobacterium sp. J-070]
MAERQAHVAGSDLRLDGLEIAVDQAVPQLVGALVDFLGQKGVLDLGEFAAFLRTAHDPDPRLEDTAGQLITTLAALTEEYAGTRASDR